MSDRNNPSIKDIMKSLFGKTDEKGDEAIAPSAGKNPVQDKGEKTCPDYDKKGIYEQEILPLVKKAVNIAIENGMTMLNVVHIKTTEIGKEVAMSVSIPMTEDQTPYNSPTEILMMQGIATQGARGYLTYLIKGIADGGFPLTKEEFMLLGGWAHKHVAKSMLAAVMSGEHSLTNEERKALKEWALKQ